LCEGLCLCRFGCESFYWDRRRECGVEPETAAAVATAAAATGAAVAAAVGEKAAAPAAEAEGTGAVLDEAPRGGGGSSPQRP